MVSYAFASILSFLLVMIGVWAKDDKSKKGSEKKTVRILFFGGCFFFLPRNLMS